MIPFEKSPTLASRAVAAWLSRAKLVTAGLEHWYVEISLYADDDVGQAQLHLNVYPDEWSIIFRFGRRASSIRITDEAAVNGRDDHHLLDEVGELSEFGGLLSRIEQSHGLRLHRANAEIRTDVPRAIPLLRAWLHSL